MHWSVPSWLYVVYFVFVCICNDHLLGGWDQVASNPPIGHSLDIVWGKSQSLSGCLGTERMNVFKCTQERPYFGKSFFPYTFLEHGFGNLGFRKNHCRPWYILHNCKSTDLKTNLKHLDKVLHNHKHMLNNKMCFVREIESSFFWSELERMQIPQFNSARDRDGGKLRRNFWDSFAWFDPHSPRCSLYCCICTLSLYLDLHVLDMFMKKGPIQNCSKKKTLTS